MHPPVCSHSRGPALPPAAAAFLAARSSSPLHLSAWPQRASRPPTTWARRRRPWRSVLPGCSSAALGRFDWPRQQQTPSECTSLAAGQACGAQESHGKGADEARVPHVRVRSVSRAPCCKPACQVPCTGRQACVPTRPSGNPNPAGPRPAGDPSGRVEAQACCAQTLGPSSRVRRRGPGPAPCTLHASAVRFRFRDRWQQ